MTRQEALIAAREFHGDLGMISSGEMLPRFVWKIGEIGRTIGRGKTWEEALKRTRPGSKE